MELAERHGAVLNRNETVIDFEVNSSHDRITVKTTKGIYEAAKLIIAAGSWIGKLLPEYASTLKIFRQVLFWFDSEGSIEPYQSPRFPIFIWTAGKDIDQLYGFPAIDGQRGVKVATEQYETTIKDPDAVVREVSQQEVEQMQQHVLQFLPALKGKCLKAASCLYTVTPDSRFVIDFHPTYPNVVVASPCSGHGFKHSAAIGEILSQMVLDGKAALDISSFSLRRLHR